MEKTASLFTPFIHKERSFIGKIIEQTKLNVSGELATAFSIGRLYHSHCHVDANMFYTLLTVGGPEDTETEMMSFITFVFPHNISGSR